MNGPLRIEVGDEQTTTELKERIAELTAANERLSSFSYAIAHDLRAPVRAITCRAHTLLADIESESIEHSRASLERIVSAAGRMSGIIDGLLTLAGLPGTQVVAKEVDLALLAHETPSGLLAERSAPLPAIEIAPELWTVGDPNLLRILFTNLLGNALKFSERVERPLLAVEHTEVDGEAVYCVRDNGVGFDESRAQRLFEPFERLHTATEFEGAGLGLAICAQVVRRLGGRIWIHSSVGVGTTVFFTLGAVLKEGPAQVAA